MILNVFFKKTVLTAALMFIGSGLACAEGFKKTPKDIYELANEEVYELSHSPNSYNLYQIDMVFNLSDQYIDSLVRSVKDFTDVDFYRIFAEKQLSDTQKKEFTAFIKDAIDKDGFDLPSRVNLAVQVDNAINLNQRAKLGLPIPKKPENFKPFDIDEYYNGKFDTYILLVKQILNTQVDPYERDEIIKTAGVLPKQSLINMVMNTPYKPKLRSLIIQEIKERDLSDLDKAYIYFWTSLATDIKPS